MPFQSLGPLPIGPVANRRPTGDLGHIDDPTARMRRRPWFLQDVDRSAGPRSRLYPSPAVKAAATSYSIGYCTNVHAGVDLASIRRNLTEYAVPVREDLELENRLGVGLWLPCQAADELFAAGSASLVDFLDEHQLHPYTINGFPYDNFHQPAVKQRVYLPAWWEESRLLYTERLAGLLAAMLPSTEHCGSISTLPIGWRDNPFAADGGPTDDQVLAAALNLQSLADFLQQLETDTGRRIVVAIEPEPGCILDTADGVVEWFDRHLAKPHHRRYLTVCHDICHSAVMMESQSEVLRRYADAGIGIGKVQVSNAVVADWESMPIEGQREAIAQLANFAEDRYLHQTGRRTEGGGFELAEDLPPLLAAADRQDSVGGDRRWVVHFHVPIFLERFGHLSTSQGDVVRCLRTLADPALSMDFTGHLEIETYAWTVLPQSMRQQGLAADIAEEFRWLRRTLLACGIPFDD